MKTIRLLQLPLLLALGLCAGGYAQAQNTQVAAADTSLTRAQVKMDRDEFLKSHRWDEMHDQWVMQPSFDPPQGVKSRAEVKASRDEFLRLNRWDESRGGWQLRTPDARSMGNKSRAQVRMETAQFMKTHRWDEQSEAWVDRSTRKP